MLGGRPKPKLCHIVSFALTCASVWTHKPGVLREQLPKYTTALRGSCAIKLPLAAGYIFTKVSASNTCFKAKVYSRRPIWT